MNNIMQNVLTEFINYDDQAYSYKLESQSIDKSLTVYHYKFHSQRWPIHEVPTVPSTIWVHNLIIYVPKILKHNQVLLCVGGGYNANKEGQEDWLQPKELFDFAKMATTNMAPVVNLQNVPNQFLLINGTAKKEDQILAMTYKLFIEDPIKNIYLPGHLPMAKAIIKAMDASEEILKEEHAIEVDSFVLTGISKRGWASWLAAIEDDRVSAIIPVAIDILNVQKSIVHICSVYKDGCPYALRDYREEGITELISSEGFAELMKIEDPFSYLGAGYSTKYQEQFTKLAKYIINSSGDDFFVPDCSKFYFQDLPGEANFIRYLPNSLHYLRGNFISDATGNLQKVENAVSDFFYFTNNNAKLPKVSYNFHKDIIFVNSSVAPKAAVLWIYNNEEERDFRFLSSYSNWHLFKKKIVSFFYSELCDRCYDQQEIGFESNTDAEVQIVAKLPSFEQGWQASFLELHYNIDDHEFIITTEVNLVSANHSINIYDEL
jgi:PhoPQ-activated pathogenicity-related protein